MEAMFVENAFEVVYEIKCNTQLCPFFNYISSRNRNICILPVLNNSIQHSHTTYKFGGKGGIRCTEDTWCSKYYFNFMSKSRTYLLSDYSFLKVK